MGPARYLREVVAAFALLVGAVMLTNFLVDPLQFFRPAPYPPLWAEEQRRQVVGVARSLPFEGAIFGNSSMGTLSARALGDALGIRVTHLGINGSTLFEQRRLLTLALSRRRLRTVVWGISDYELTASPPADRIRSDIADPYFLYSDNPLLWTRYLFDLTAFRSSVTILSSRLIGTRYANVDPETLPAPPSSWVYGAEALQRSVERQRASCPMRARIPGSVFRPVPRAWADHVEARLGSIRDIIARHPHTQFELVFPPVHISFYRDAVLCSDNRLDLLSVHRRLSEHLAGLPNVSMHDFRADPIVFGESEFYDAAHFSRAAAQRIVEDVVARRRVVTAEGIARNREALLDALRAEICDRTPGVQCVRD